mmetsp:Transcript_145596/g.363136  ORF Transcript_145596/g.363136 Transcript_145596/m.363136 type:complete len:425 (+) Transcript_145596:56-1330(+)
MPFDLGEPLLPKPALGGSQVRSFLRAYGVPAAVAILCVTVGVMHPLAAEAAKSTRLTVCTSQQGGHVQCSSVVETDGKDGRRTVMPFYAVTLTISAEVASVIFAFFATAASEGSIEAARKRLFTPRATFRLWPVGVAYGVGDLLQAFACNSASAPVVLVIGQCKLLLTAVLTMLVLGSKGPSQWGNLTIITLAAIAGAHNGATHTYSSVIRAAEVKGAFLALLKAGLSASGAVISERFYKDSTEGFWVMSFRVQSMMLATSLALLLSMDASETPGSFGEFFSGGPQPMCMDNGGAPWCDPLGGQCECVDKVGWDGWTLLAMLAIALNGMVTGLTLKHLSAVGKAICNALAVAVFYPAYVILGFKPFDLTQAAIIGVIIISSYQYATNKTKKPNRDHIREVPVERRRCRGGSTGTTLEEPWNCRG